ncbi:uncharacterized protein LOC108845653 [Raphanus sativus]|uniref:Uncharacterized protein LOC108845653 n=1 Tax=Raphanus sativus TaxID=3726 RepID=A0A6J0MR04_RAPSA|nr:uncharacterized protein LOC108845653 [Raphanus sativus]
MFKKKTETNSLYSNTKKNSNTKKGISRGGPRYEYLLNHTLDLGTYGRSNLTDAQKRRQKRERSWTPEPELDNFVNSEEGKLTDKSIFGMFSKNIKNKKKNIKKNNSCKKNLDPQRLGGDDGGDEDDGGDDLGGGDVGNDAPLIGA